MKRLSLTLVGRLSRVQRRAGVLMLLLALAGAPAPGCPGRSVDPRRESTGRPPLSTAQPGTVRAALAHVLSAQPEVPGSLHPAGAATAVPDQQSTLAAADAAPSAPRQEATERPAHLLSGLQLLGQKTLPFRWVQVSGSENARRAFKGQASRTGSMTEMTVMGRLLDLLDVNWTLSDNAYGADNRRIMARVQQGSLDLRVGDVAAGFDGNSLVPFQRQVRGAVAEQQLSGDTRVTALVSTERAPTRRVVVPGNNTAGPYYLNAFPIDVESVRVRIDDADIARDAYTIDAYAGTITFLGGRIVPQTSVLRVHFATRSEGLAGGTLYGARLTHQLGGGHTLGVTAMAQEEVATARAGDEATGRERLDDWLPGHADSAGPYQLRYGPVVAGSERVFVGGVLQQAGIDYVIDADRGVIQFGRLILSSEPIRVVYRQRVTVGADPAGQILGVDGRFKLGKSAQVTAQLARSIGGAAATGNALTLEGKVGLMEDGKGQPRMRLNAALSSIDPGYSPLDGGSFLRNDRGLSLDGEFAVNPYVRLYSRWQQSRRAVGQGTAFAGELLDARELVSGASVCYPGWPTLTIQSSRLNQDGKSGDHAQASDSVRLELGRRRFQAAAEWGRGETKGQPFAYLGAAATAPANTETARLSLGYSPSDRLSLNANGVVSDIRTLADGQERESTAKSVDLTATFRASRSVQLNASYVLADSGAPAGIVSGTPATGLPLTRGSAAVSSLPGFGTTPGIAPGLAYGGNQRVGRLGLTYSPGRRFNLSAHVDASDTELYGEATGHSLGFSFAPIDRLTLTGNLTRQASRLSVGGTSFGGSGLSSDLTYLSLRAAPVGRLTMNLEYQHLAARAGASLSGGSGPSALPGGSLANETHSWTGRMSHPVGGHTAFLQYQQVDYGGAVGQARKGSATAGVDLRLGQVLGLTLDVELHRFRDERRPADSYRARIVSGNLSARF
jgi:hypothetical protein